MKASCYLLNALVAKVLDSLQVPMQPLIG